MVDETRTAKAPLCAGACLPQRALRELPSVSWKSLSARPLTYVSEVDIYARTKRNPYTTQHAPETCAACGTPIEQQPSGRRRRYCPSDQCRRTGRLNEELAAAWQQGWDAASRARTPPTTSEYDQGHQDGYTAGQAATHQRYRDLIDKLAAATRRHLNRCANPYSTGAIDHHIRAIRTRTDIGLE